MKKGKLLESIVRIVQEALKDNPKTNIYQNYKLENSSGRSREIDILIEGVINSFPIVIAIECKEYNKKVPVEKVEAFEGKCQRLNRVDKKVMVSVYGFQADAINAAKDFNILLYTVNELSEEEVSEIIFQKPIAGIGPVTTVKSVRFNHDGNVSNEIKVQKENFVAFYNGEEVSIKNVVMEFLASEGKRFDNFLLSNFEYLARSVDKKKELTFNYKILVDGLYFKDGSEKCNIHSIELDVQCVIEKKIFDNYTTYSYKKSGEKEGVEITRHMSSEGNDYFDVIKSEKDGLQKFISSDSEGNHVVEIEYVFSFDDNNQLVRRKMQDDH